MAKRPVFYISDGKICSKDVEFEWAPGFAVSQKRKNINHLHEKLDSKALEVSTKSEDTLGVKLSAFNLTLYGRPLENVFQSSKVFEKGGPYRDLLEVNPKVAKRDPRLKESGKLVKFNYNGTSWPLESKTAFYDYIYYNAVRRRIKAQELEALSKVKYFSDIEFNPQKSINTQARAIVIVKRIYETYGVLPYFSPEAFMELHKKIVSQ